MSKITFTAPCETGALETITGDVALLDVGGERHRFVIHDGNLSDYRSGYRVASLQAIKVERMARISTYTRTTDRQAAQILITRLIDRHGLAKVRETLAKHPTLNPAPLSNRQQGSRSGYAKRQAHA